MRNVSVQVEPFLSTCSKELQRCTCSQDQNLVSLQLTVDLVDHVLSQRKDLVAPNLTSSTLQLLVSHEKTFVTFCGNYVKMSTRKAVSLNLFWPNKELVAAELSVKVNLVLMQ